MFARAVFRRTAGEKGANQVADSAMRIVHPDAPFPTLSTTVTTLKEFKRHNAIKGGREPTDRALSAYRNERNERPFYPQ